MLSLQGFNLCHSLTGLSERLSSFFYDLRAELCKNNPGHAMRKKVLSKNKRGNTITQSALPPASVVLNSSSVALSVVVHNPPGSWEKHG